MSEFEITIPRRLVTIVYNGSEFAHRSWIRFFKFFISPKSLLNSSGSHWILILNALEFILRDPLIRINCRRVASMVNCVFDIQSDSTLEIAPRRPKNIHGAWNSTYIIVVYMQVYTSFVFSEGSASVSRDRVVFVHFVMECHMKFMPQLNCWKLLTLWQFFNLVGKKISLNILNRDTYFD